ncbi:MAG: hypothetical protein KDC98_14715 [Planctomycetes bacterium]|nr:hypothetical protein [Planctomycetota bacterium]
MASLVLGLTAPASPCQQEPHDGGAVNRTTIEIAANGDANEHVVYMVTTSDYNRLNKGGIGSTFFHRLLGSFRADWNEKPGSYVFERKESNYQSLELTICEEGLAKNRGNGNWEYKVTADAIHINTSKEDGRPVLYFQHKGNILPAAGCISPATTQNGLGTYSGPFIVRLPQEATDVSWEPRSRRVSYRLPAVAGTGPSRLEARVETRENVMSTAYKVYSLYLSKGKFSDQWVARSIFTNSGDGVIKDLRVTYKMRHAGEITNHWPELIPGQTLVDVCYPSFESSITDDKSSNTLPIEVTWVYDDADGKTREDSRRTATTVQGRNGFVFSDLKAGTRHEMLSDDLSNAPLLAAWVSQNDDPIMNLAGTAQDFATRLNANLTTEDKLEWIYNTLLVCGVQYKYPPVVQQNGVDVFDKKTVQFVRLPRDVIFNRSGTCIDLAICYSAMVLELGLSPYLMLIPGHCFPVVKVGTDLVGIEATMVQAGPNGGRPWREALAKGMEELKQNINNPDALLVDLKELWGDGVSPPQLERWDPDIMKRLGLGRDELFARFNAMRNAEPAEPQTPNNNPPVRRGGQFEDDDRIGSWIGSGSAAGHSFSVEVTFENVGRSVRLTLSAKLDNALVVESYEGSKSASVLKLQTRTVTDVATNEVRRDTATKTEMFVTIESSNTILIERQRRDRNEPKELFRLSRA